MLWIAAATLRLLGYKRTHSVNLKLSTKRPVYSQGSRCCCCLEPAVCHADQPALLLLSACMQSVQLLCSSMQKQSRTGRAVLPKSRQQSEAIARPPGFCKSFFTREESVSAMEVAAEASAEGALKSVHEGFGGCF